MTTVNCIECEAEVSLDDDLILGELLECPDCGVELEVVALHPVTLAVAPEVEEDWGE